MVVAFVLLPIASPRNWTSLCWRWQQHGQPTMAWQGPMEVFYHPAFLSNGIWTPTGEKEDRSIYQHSGPWSTYTRIIGNVQLVIYWILMQYRVNKGGRVPGAILQRSHSIGTTFLSTWGQHVGSPWPEKALTQAPPQTLSCYHSLIWTSHAFHPNPRPCSLQVSLQRRVLISPIFLSFLPCFSWSDTLHSLQWLDLWVEYPENTKKSCSSKDNLLWAYIHNFLLLKGKLLLLSFELHYKTPPLRALDIISKKGSEVNTELMQREHVWMWLYKSFRLYLYIYIT